MGYNSEITKSMFKWFCENNKEEIKLCRNRGSDLFVIFKDGSEVIGITSSVNYMRGYKFDQLILCDDERWEIYWKRRSDINGLMDFTMNITNVPEEYQILEYLYDKRIDE